MYQRILVPTDCSDVADAAAEAAIALARLFDADLVAIHAPEPGVRSPGTGDRADDPAPSRGEEALNDIAERAADAGLEVTTAVVDGDAPIHRLVLGYAAEHDVDCIVMGTHGRTGLDRFALGSVTERTVRESPVPVVTVHEGTVVTPGMEAILVPTDGSESAGAAIDHAVELVGQTGAALHVVHVVDLGIVWDEAGAGRLLEALEESGARALEAAIGRAETSDVPAVEASVLSGAPHRAIVEYAAEHDVDCIVMGTHGRTGLERYFLGSVTERVIRLADVPVLTVKGSEPVD
jgi:nucleotide-binding universal stress UspA family protein